MASTGVSKSQLQKKGMEKRKRPEGFCTRCQVDLYRSLLQRCDMSPKLTTKEPGTWPASIHLPSACFTCSPPTSSCCKIVGKPQSVCSPQPVTTGSPSSPTAPSPSFAGE